MLDQAIASCSTVSASGLYVENANVLTLDLVSGHGSQQKALVDKKERDGQDEGEPFVFTQRHMWS